MQWYQVMAKGAKTFTIQVGKRQETVRHYICVFYVDKIHQFVST
jgi:hypothetical protein